MSRRAIGFGMAVGGALGAWVLRDVSALLVLLCALSVVVGTALLIVARD